MVVQKLHQVRPVPGLQERLSDLHELVVGEEALAPGDLFGRADLGTLPPLDRAHEVAGVVEGVEGAGVEPGGATREDLDAQPALLEVDPVEVGDLQLAARGRLQLVGVIDDVVAVEVEPRDGELTLGLGGLLLQRQRSSLVVELDDAGLLQRADALTASGYGDYLRSLLDD